MKVKRDESKKSGKTSNKPLLPTRRSTRKRSLLFLSSDVTDTNITLEDDHSNNESHKRKRTNVDEIDDSLVRFLTLYTYLF